MHNDETASDCERLSGLSEFIFPSDRSGKSFLDIGSRGGEVCLHALKSGVGSALGIDPDPARIDSARMAAKALGLPAEFACAEFEKFDAGGRSFDIVTSLGVLHHMYDPVHSLRKMMSMVRERLVVEFEEPANGSSRIGTVIPWLAAGSRKASIELASERRISRAAEETFLFTDAAMRILINKHNCRFDAVTFHASPAKHRRIAIALKRRVHNCVVVAGPSSSGKTTFARSLMAKQEQFQSLPRIDASWRTLSARQLTSIEIGRSQRVIFHYDFTRPVGNAMRVVERDPAAGFLEVCDKLSIVTLMPPPTQLRKQFLASSKSELHSLRKREIHAAYFTDMALLRSWYAQWFAFLARFKSTIETNILLSRGDDMPLRVGPAKHWDVIFDELYGA